MICQTCKGIFAKENITKIKGVPYCIRCGKIRRRNIAKLRRQHREAAYKDLGLVKTRGALGGTYYE